VVVYLFHTLILLISIITEGVCFREILLFQPQVSTERKMKFPFKGKESPENPDPGRTFLPKSRRMTKIDYEDLSLRKSFLEAQARLELVRTISKTFDRNISEQYSRWEMFLNFLRTLHVGNYSPVEFRVEEKESMGKTQFSFLIQNPPRHNSNMKALGNKGLNSSWKVFSEKAENIFRNWDSLTLEEQELLRKGFFEFDQLGRSIEIPSDFEELFPEPEIPDDSHLLKRIPSPTLEEVENGIRELPEE